MATYVTPRPLHAATRLARCLYGGGVVNDTATVTERKTKVVQPQRVVDILEINRLAMAGWVYLYLV